MSYSAKLSLYAAMLACSIAPVARADIYQYVDANGTLHFSNVPTDPRFKLIIQSPQTPPAADDIANDLQRLAVPVAYDALIDFAARKHSIEPSLLRAVIMVESGGNPHAVSKRGASGLMQLTRATAKRYGVREIFDPQQNVTAGARYLRDLIERYRDLELALAAYNAGEAKVEQYGLKIPPYRETLDYVPRVLRIYRHLRAPRSAAE